MGHGHTCYESASRIALYGAKETDRGVAWSLDGLSRIRAIDLTPLIFSSVLGMSTRKGCCDLGSDEGDAYGWMLYEGGGGRTR